MKRMLVLLLDSASPPLIEKWTDDGSLPNLKRLREGGRYGRLGSVAEWLAEATCYSLYSGRNPGATGLHCFTMWQKESMKLRPPGRDWLPYEPFWRSFGQGGPRAVVLDAANVYPPEPFNGVEIIGWATHDTLAPFQSYPPETAAWVDRHFGSMLIGDERYGLLTKREFLADRQHLLDLSRKFADLCIALMERETWDLLLASVMSVHHGGHRLWSTVNLSEPVPEAERQVLSEALHEIYIACDEGIGRIVQAAGPDTLVMILSSEGMDVSNTRTWIFPEMVRRVTQDGGGAPGRLQKMREWVPVEWRHAIKSRLPFNMRRQLTGFWRTRDYQWDRTRAFSLFSITQGCVRINVKGREAQGIVEPGAEYEALCQEITDALMTFVDADTGQPVIKDVIRSRDVFHGEHLEDLPDLIVRWSDSPAAMHRAVVSPKFGTIPWPTPGQNPDGRSGNHQGQGILIVAGPQVKSGSIEKAHILDFAPTVLSLLGQPVPAEMEGKPLQLLD